MPSRNQTYVYWDSCVFLALLNREQGRVDDIEALWDEIATEVDDRIITTASSIAEVAFVEAEKLTRTPNPQVLAKIENMWRDSSIQLIDLTPGIARIARDMVRDVISMGMSLKPLDSVQLATAFWVDQNVHIISAFHTYDGQLRNFRPFLRNMPMGEPRPSAPRLPLNLDGPNS